MASWAILECIFFQFLLLRDEVSQKADCRAEVRLASVLELSALKSPSLEEPGWAHFRQGHPVVGGRLHVMTSRPGVLTSWTRLWEQFPQKEYAGYAIPTSGPHP